MSVVTRRVPAPRSGPPPGVVTHDARGGVLRVRVAGEVDLWLRPRMQQVVSAVRHHPGPVEVDLEGVTFFGAEGVRMLLALHRARIPGAVTLVATSAAVERTLRVCGITEEVVPRHRGPS